MWRGLRWSEGASEGGGGGAEAASRPLPGWGLRAGEGVCTGTCDVLCVRRTHRRCGAWSVLCVSRSPGRGASVHTRSPVCGLLPVLHLCAHGLCRLRPVVPWATGWSGALCPWCRRGRAQARCVWMYGGGQRLPQPTDTSALGLQPGRPRSALGLCRCATGRLGGGRSGLGKGHPVGGAEGAGRGPPGRERLRRGRAGTR